MSGKVKIEKSDQAGLTVGKEYDVIGTIRSHGYLYYKVIGDDGWIKAVAEDEVDGGE